MSAQWSSSGDIQRANYAAFNLAQLNSTRRWRDFRTTLDRKQWLPNVNQDVIHPNKVRVIDIIEPLLPVERYCRASTKFTLHEPLKGHTIDLAVLYLAVLCT